LHPSLEQLSVRIARTHDERQRFDFAGFVVGVFGLALHEISVEARSRRVSIGG
jgi:hypothetical protein